MAVTTERNTGTPSRRRARAFRLACIAGGIVFGLLLAELLARCYWRTDEGPPPEAPGPFPGIIGKSHIRSDPELGFVLEPGFRGTIVEPQSKAFLRVNSYGMRGPEPDLEASSAADRWLVVGDSFALALQVEEAQTFEQRLAAKLGREVWNGGVDCYSTFQASRWYQRLDDRVGFGTVILVFFLGNDLVDNINFLSSIEGPEHIPLPPRLPVLPLADEYETTTPILKHSVLYKTLKLRWNLARKGWLWSPERFGDSLMLAEAYLETGEPLQRRIAVTRRALMELRNEVTRRGDRLLVALAPPLFEVDSEDMKIWLDELERHGMATSRNVHTTHEGVLALLKELAIPCCDLTPALKQATASGTRCYLSENRHWTPAGHQVVADELERCIQAELTNE